MKTKFDLGEITIDCIAKKRLNSDSIQSALKRHADGDWGHVPSINAFQNDCIVKNGGCHGMILSHFYDSNKTEFWIATDTLRKQTLVYIPGEMPQ